MQNVGEKVTTEFVHVRFINGIKMQIVLKNQPSYILSILFSILGWIQSEKEIWVLALQVGYTCEIYLPQSVLAILFHQRYISHGGFGFKLGLGASLFSLLVA